MNPVTPHSPLELPVTGQTLRLTLQRGDLSALMDCARQLRVAGYRVDPLGLAADLLETGCAQITDSFGHNVALHVKVPRAAAPLLARQTAVPFRVAL